MKLQWILLIVVSTTDLIWCAPTNSHIVSGSNPYCEVKGEIIFCDFKSQKDSVYMVEPVGNPNIGKVFIYSASKLYLSDKACVDIAIHNVRETSVNKSTDGECNKRFELSATKSSFKSIHSGVSKLYLEECNVENLHLDSDLDKINIIKSDIQVLNFTGHLVSKATMVLQESHVESIEKLPINSGSRLLVQKSQVDFWKFNGLNIINGSVTITDSSVQEARMDHFIIEISENDISLRGNHNFGTKSEQTNRDAYGCQQNNSYVVLFYICLVLLLISWISFLMYHKKDLILKHTASRHGENDALSMESEGEKDPCINCKRDAANMDPEVSDKKGKQNKCDKTAFKTEQKIVDIKNKFEIHLKELETQRSEFQKLLKEGAAQDNSSQVQNNATEDQENSSKVQDKSKNFENKDHVKFNTTLTNLQTTIVNKYSHLAKICKQEGTVLDLVKTTKNIEINTNLQITDFFRDQHNILVNCKTSKSDIEMVGKIVKEHEGKFSLLIQDMGLPVDHKTKKHFIEFKKLSSHKKKENSNTMKEDSNTMKENSNTMKENSNTMKEDSNTMKENSNTMKENSNTMKEKSNTMKENQIIYQISKKKITAFIDEVGNLQESLLQLYVALINNTTEHANKYLLLLLNIQIEYLRFLLKKY